MSTVTQITYIPKVFVIRKSLNKVALTDNYLDCRKYVSRSGLTFNGCYEYSNGSLTEVRGIYYLKAHELMKFETRRKMSRDIDVTINFVKNLLKLTSSLKDLELPEPLLIYYDNSAVYIYDNYVKGRMLDFPVVGEQGHLSIYSIPEPHIDDIETNTTNTITIFNHTVTFSTDVKVYHVHSTPGDSILVENIANTPLKITMNSQDHGTAEVTTDARWLLFDHPRPSRGFYD